MSNFLSNYTHTENGALTHVSTNSAVLDFFSRAGAMRGYDILPLFEKAFDENPQLALRAALWLRDVRGGAGERDLFRNILVWLSHQRPLAYIPMMYNAPEFGRWDDLIEVLDKLYPKEQELTLNFIQTRLYVDPLLGKWLPSENAGKRSAILAKIIRRHLKFSSRGYRKLLTVLRRGSYIVEHDMSDRKWDKIDYGKVPSRANLVYKDAFMKHDGDRYIENLSKLKSNTIMPYELYKQMRKFDPRVLDALWNNLPDYMDGSNVLVLADVSGSMAGDPMFVSVSLALYGAQRTKGAFHNMFVTFQEIPRIMQLPEGNTRELMEFIASSPWGGSTDLIDAFELMLGIAVKHKVPQSEMPTVLFVVSDMEFNQADHHYETNHESIKRRFAEAGYTMPVLVYWNVRARNAQSPVTMSESGTVLVSGLSATIFKNVLSLDFGATYESEGEEVEVQITPMEAMLQILNSERYSVI